MTLVEDAEEVRHHGPRPGVGGHRKVGPVVPFPSTANRSPVGQSLRTPVALLRGAHYERTVRTILFVCMFPATRTLLPGGSRMTIDVAAPRANVLSSRFVDALAFAIKAHGDQPRKGGSVTYVAHLLGTASLVLESGGDEEMAIAGLLHDTIEDTDTDAQEIVAAFGPRVAGIVEACTDTNVQPKPPWRERKERYLAHLCEAETSPDVLVVSRADKLHNARAILQDYRDLGDELWSRFKEGSEQQLWYYGALAAIFTERLPDATTDELRRVVDELRARVKEGQPHMMAHQEHCGPAAG